MGGEFYMVDFGYFSISVYTKTRIGGEDIMKICRKKDVVEKVFMGSKSLMESLYAHIKGGNAGKSVLFQSRICNHRHDCTQV